MLVCVLHLGGSSDLMLWPCFQALIHENLGMGLQCVRLVLYVNTFLVGVDLVGVHFVEGLTPYCSMGQWS